MADGGTCPNCREGVPDGADVCPHCGLNPKQKLFQFALGVVMVGGLAMWWDQSRPWRVTQWGRPMSSTGSELSGEYTTICPFSM